MYVPYWHDKLSTEMLAEADKIIIARRKQYEEGLITVSELVNCTIAALADLHHYCAVKDGEHRMREICAEMITERFGK